MKNSSFEYLCGYATTSCGQFLLLAIYRPGSQAVSTAFYDDLSAVFEHLTTYSCPVVICGDFNIHVDQPGDSKLYVFTNCLSRLDTFSTSLGKPMLPDTRWTLSSPGVRPSFPAFVPVT